MKKILHIVDRLSIGGVTTFIKNLAIHQLSENKISILTIENSKFDDKGPVDEILNSEVELLRLSLHKYNPYSIIKLQKYIRANDIIHVHQFPSLYWVGLASIFQNTKKFIFTEHIYESNRRKKALIPFERFIYNRFDRVIGVSQSVAIDLNNWINLPKKITFINNGININTEHIDINEEIKSQFLGKKLVIMAARIGEPKNQKTLIQAFALLDNTYHLLLAGDGPLVNEMKDLIQKLNLTNKVTFLGRRNDVLSLMKTCDLSVLSSYSEGLPLGLLESLSVGTPCIGSDIKTIRPVLNNKDMLFTVDDEKELADKIRISIEDKDMNFKLVQYGKTLIKNYSIETMVNKYLETYER